jgi:hypothetical protein
LCGAFPTKRPRTSGSETHVRGENGAVGKNGVVNKYRVLSKNDALDSNDAPDSAVNHVEQNVTGAWVLHGAEIAAFRGGTATRG